MCLIIVAPPPSLVVAPGLASFAPLFRPLMTLYAMKWTACKVTEWQYNQAVQASVCAHTHYSSALNFRLFAGGPVQCFFFSATPASATVRTQFDSDSIQLFFNMSPVISPGGFQRPRSNPPNNSRRHSKAESSGTRQLSSPSFYGIGDSLLECLRFFATLFNFRLLLKLQQIHPESRLSGVGLIYNPILFVFLNIFFSLSSILLFLFLHILGGRKKKP